MKNIFQIFILVFFFSATGVSARENINGYLGIGYNIVSQQSPLEQGTRSRVNLEFGRLEKSVSLDLQFGNGLGYRDIGFNLAVFNVFKIPDDNSWFRITLGSGLTGQFNSTAPKFWDWGVYLPHVRFIADFGMGLALSLNAGYELSFIRDFTTAEIESEKTMKSRMVFGLSLLTTSAWLE